MEPFLILKNKKTITKTNNSNKTKQNTSPKQNKTKQNKEQ